MLNSDTTMKSDSPANLPAEGGAGRNADVERKGRKASKETRRQQLIEATIDSLASLAIGLKDWTQMTDDQFKQASDFLREVHKNVRLYWTDNTDLSQAMASGEVDLAWAWNDAAVQSAAAGAPIVSTRDTEEGLSTWVCGYVRVKGAPGSADKAYDFLNAINDPAVASYLVTDWGYGHADAKSMAEVDPEVVKSQCYGDVEKFVDKTLFQSPVPAELKQKMIEEFEKIKAGY